MTSFKTVWDCIKDGKSDFLSTGNGEIDQLIGKLVQFSNFLFLGGGIAKGTITEISGEAGCGKTQFWFLFVSNEK